jgi:hypothetical protein
MAERTRVHDLKERNVQSLDNRSGPKCCLYSWYVLFDVSGSDVRNRVEAGESEHSGSLKTRTFSY